MSSASSKASEVDQGLLVKLAISDINMARIFVETSRAAFSTGMTGEGQFARLRAIKFYCSALGTALQLEALTREQFSSDIEYLRIQIEWLLMQPKAQDSQILLQETALMKNLLKLLMERAEISG